MPAFNEKKRVEALANEKCFLSYTLRFINRFFTVPTNPGSLCYSRFFASCHGNSCDFFCAPQHLFKSLDRYLQRIDTISLKENDSSACFFPPVTITKPSLHDCIRRAFSFYFPPSFGISFFYNMNTLNT